MLRSSRTRSTSTSRQGAEQPPLLGHLEDCWDEPIAEAALVTDLELLQGAWVAISDRRQVEFLIAAETSPRVRQRRAEPTGA